MITFSFRPARSSTRPLIAASVSTRVVSWNDAAESHDFCESDAFVTPCSSGCAVGGVRPSLINCRFTSSYEWRSTNSPGSHSESPDSSISTLRSICRTITSMCLSWMFTPCAR